jgi:hypothetical protein
MGDGQGWGSRFGWWFVGVLAGAVVTHFVEPFLPSKEHIHSRVLGFPTATSLLGTWDVEWTENGKALPKDPPVELSQADGVSLEGRGSTSADNLGEYELSGTVSDFAVAFTYRYPGRKELVGVVVLQRKPDGKNGGTILEGNWSQFSAAQNKITGGTTTWRQHLIASQGGL